MGTNRLSLCISFVVSVISAIILSLKLTLIKTIQSAISSTDLYAIILSILFPFSDCDSKFGPDWFTDIYANWAVC
jgi:hypothetical protein